tara:strand:- start:1622 stop:1945 length:324 start_codon:yes stop_codon:yes gene_type:complete
LKKKTITSSRNLTGQNGNGRKIATTWSKVAMQKVHSKADLIAERLVKIALTDTHPGQMAAIKLCMDRLVPITKAVDADALAGKSVSINISVEGVKKDEGRLIEQAHE